MSISYAEAGVDINAGDKAVQMIKKHVKKTHTPAVLTDLGGFGGAISLKSALAKYKHPVLVQSTDSVGTKVIVAQMTDKYESVGRDLVGNVVGDILVMGAKPLTFLDYLAYDKIDPNRIERIVKGISQECKESGMALIGGEMAELPGVYQKNETDIVGFVTGIVEKDKIITGKKIKVGDAVLGIASNGLLTNGFTLARKIMFEIGKYKVTDKIEELGMTVGEALMAPHKNYTKPIRAVLEAGIVVNGMAHITGGGLTGNIPRILPQGCAVKLDKSAWPKLPIFSVLQNVGQVEEKEMYHTFNMGIGIVMILPKKEADMAMKQINKLSGYQIYEIGKVVTGKQQVLYK